MKWLLRLTAVLGVCVFGFAASADEARRASAPIVVELFTSQGCSSCPPADMFAGDLAKRDDVIALTFNVDYWDYLGWKDTLGSSANTQRQRAYADTMRSRRVYTPQMIIDGQTHEVGSDRRAVRRVIESLQSQSAERVKISFRHDADRIIVGISDGPHRRDATIWLARFDATQTVEIARGENGGKDLTYYNVVRDIRNLGLWRGEAMEIALSQDDLARGGRDGCVVIIQEGSHGPILGAADMAIGGGRS